MSEQHRTKSLNEFKELENIENDQYLIGIDDIDIGNGARIKFDNFVNSCISSDENNKIILGTDNKLYNLSAVSLYLEDMVYKSGDWVLGDVSDERNMYESLQDDNIGNALTNTSYWKKIEFDTSEIEEQLATKVDLPTATSASFPSNRYIDLTLGASGTTYTAPANGWLSIAGTGQQVNPYNFISLTNTTKKIETFNWITIDNYIGCYIPCMKNDVISINYSQFTKRYFRFIYAEGSN